MFRRMVSWLLLALLISVGASDAQQQQQQAQIKSIVILTGKCQFQLVQGFFPCKENVAWMTLSNGRSFLSFVAPDGERMFTVNGGPDRQPNLENYYLQIDTFRIMKGAEIQGEDRNMEGECHFSLNKDATVFHFVKCDIYNRQRHTMYNFYLEDIQKMDRKTF